jgi:hypothetical protein
MRTEKQLFQLMLEHQDLFFGGLCGWVDRMYYSSLINDKEYSLMAKYLNKNKPLDAKRFWFPSGEIAPRIKWIKQQIEKL